MNRSLSKLCSVLMLVLLLLPVARAEPSTKRQMEVEFLLGAIERSGCDFYRNGTWYDAQTAQAHLRDKYRYLTATGRIDSAEDFIEKAATASSMSGESYRIKCGAGAAMTSGQWLRDQLARFRTRR